MHLRYGQATVGSYRVVPGISQHVPGIHCFLHRHVYRTGGLLYLHQLPYLRADGLVADAGPFQEDAVAQLRAPSARRPKHLTKSSKATGRDRRGRAASTLSAHSYR